MVQTDHHTVMILAGPTASGKSALALDIAQSMRAVIINCDSKQLYREIPIITAQPTPEEKQRVPHRLYGCISAGEHCSVARWVELARVEIDAVHAQGKVPLLVGGTGMYIKALIQGFAAMPDVDPLIREKIRAEHARHGNEGLYRQLQQRDPRMASLLKPGDTQRVMRALEVIEHTGISLKEWQQRKPITYYDPVQFRTFFLYPDRQETYNRCSNRFHAMLHQGVIEEVRALHALQLEETLPAMKAHGVPELRAYLQGKMSLEDAVEQAILNTRHYIKRQFTWYRHQMPDAKRIDTENMLLAKATILRET